MSCSKTILILGYLIDCSEIAVRGTNNLGAKTNTAQMLKIYLDSTVESSVKGVLLLGKN